jgi:hypothetical protein
MGAGQGFFEAGEVRRAEMHVRYILEGSVRRSGDDVRINAQLIDATNGAHLRAERFDGMWSDVLALQNKVVENVALALELRLVRAVGDKSPGSTSNSEAYEVYLQGLELEFRGSPQDFAGALTHFKRAIALDPAYGEALAEIAWIYEQSSGNQDRLAVEALRDTGVGLHLATGQLPGIRDRQLLDFDVEYIGDFLGGQAIAGQRSHRRYDWRAKVAALFLKLARHARQRPCNRHWHRARDGARRISPPPEGASDDEPGNRRSGQVSPAAAICRTANERQGSDVSACGSAYRPSFSRRYGLPVGRTVEV